MSLFVSFLLLCTVGLLVYVMFRQARQVYALAHSLSPQIASPYSEWRKNVALIATGAFLALFVLTPINASPAQPTVAPVNVGLPTPYPTMQRREPTVPPTNTPRPLPTETSTSLEYKPDVILKIDTVMLTATPTATPTFAPTLQASPTLSPTEIIAIVASPTTEIPVAHPAGGDSSSIASSMPQPSSASSGIASSVQSSQSSVVSSSSQNSVVRSSAVSSAASSSVIAPPVSSSSSVISIQSSSAEPGGGGGSRSSKSSSTKSGLTLPGTNSPLNLGSFIPGLIVLATAILAAYGVRAS